MAGKFTGNMTRHSIFIMSASDLTVEWRPYKLITSSAGWINYSKGAPDES